MRSLALLAVFLVGCAPPPPAPAAPQIAPARCTPAPARLALDAFIRGRHERYSAAIARARGFLDGLEVDPVKLRAAGLKGKKKLVEALDVYANLLRIAAPDQRAAILARIEALARPTREARYPDMLSIGDRQFHEDATSYLRAAYLLDRLGLDVRRYREEIARVKGRLDQHLAERGPHQRLAFHTYYRHFGLVEPFPLEGALAGGLIATRADPAAMERADAYELTHEVYAAFDFGDRLSDDPFGDGARLYLRAALPSLLANARGRRDPDLVAELTTCLRYLRFTGDPAYAEGLGYLLETQNEDGSWGSYAAARARMGDLVEVGLHLHTTMVAVESLTLGFEEASRRGEAPECA